MDSPLTAALSTFASHISGKWVDSSPYREKYPFVENGPPQGSALWDDLFKKNHEGWHLTTIKQGVCVFLIVCVAACAFELL
jgi:hypothetical protein